MTIPTVDFDFSEEEFNELIEKIRSTAEHVTDKTIPGMRPLLDLYFEYLGFVVPPWARHAAYTMLDWAIEILEDLINLVIRLLAGAVFPVTAAALGFIWRHESMSLSVLQAGLRDTAHQVGATWQGEGQRAFELHAAKHYEKVGTMADLATLAERQLFVGVGVAVSFYIALARIISGTIQKVTAAVASTPVGGGASEGAAGASAALGVAEVKALLASLLPVALYMAQAWLTLSDSTKAVRSQWPDPAASTYDDGSMSDGDGSMWSTAR